MNTYVTNLDLNKVFDEFIINDIQKKVGEISTTSSDETVECLIKYVLKHFNICDSCVTPKISNFYSKHKKFIRFILVTISLVYSPNSIKEMIEKYEFNVSLKWQIEHIIPQNQYYNKFNSKNSRLKNRIGNLGLLSNVTNVKISNQSFYKKCRGLSAEKKELKVNEVFQIAKTNLSKADILAREQCFNNYIFEIFFKNNGLLLKNKFREYNEN
ncbi:TPA: HNH endonuclease [Streptococcus suis]|nr:HNH endonuclease [Streptococcus suis]HEM6155591.1 HNH endonuclease [Streptococcus suis]HEM6278281.1 HNH endonuclease [Streptococcus suis]HEM6279729.1 HNH endonuclease [Streptococcus suis]